MAATKATEKDYGRESPSLEDDQNPTSLLKLLRVNAIVELIGGLAILARPKSILERKVRAVLARRRRVTYSRSADEARGP